MFTCHPSFLETYSRTLAGNKIFVFILPRYSLVNKLNKGSLNIRPIRLSCRRVAWRACSTFRPWSLTWLVCRSLTLHCSTRELPPPRPWPSVHVITSDASSSFRTKYTRRRSMLFVQEPSNYRSLFVFLLYSTDCFFFLFYFKRPLNIEVKVQNLSEMNFDSKDIAGFLFQYPNTDGNIENLESVIEKAKKNGVMIWNLFWF